MIEEPASFDRKSLARLREWLDDPRGGDISAFPDRNGCRTR